MRSSCSSTPKKEIINTPKKEPVVTPKAEAEAKPENRGVNAATESVAVKTEVKKEPVKVQSNVM